MVVSINISNIILPITQPLRDQENSSKEIYTQIYTNIYLIHVV